MKNKKRKIKLKSILKWYNSYLVKCTSFFEYENAVHLIR